MKKEELKELLHTKMKIWLSMDNYHYAMEKDTKEWEWNPFKCDINHAYDKIVKWVKIGQIKDIVINVEEDPANDIGQIARIYLFDNKLDFTALCVNVFNLYSALYSVRKINKGD